MELIRFDSCFFNSDILDYSVIKAMDYINAAKFTNPIQQLIVNSSNWIVLHTSIEICEQIY